MTEEQAVRRAFALAMRTLRQRAGMTQDQLAFEGLTRSHVSDLETARRDPRLSTIVLVARILQISVAKLTAEMERNLERLNAVEVESPRREIRIEEALSRLRDFMDLAQQEMKWLADTRQGAIYCNKPLRDFAGVDHLGGLGWQKLFYPDDLEPYLIHSEKMFANREPYLARYRLRGADGKYKSMVQHAVPQFTPNGIFIGFLGTLIQEPEEPVIG